MTKEEIFEIANIGYKNCNYIPNLKIPKEFIETFSKLIAEKEREECAKIAWDYGWKKVGNDDAQNAAVEIFNLIGARFKND